MLPGDILKTLLLLWYIPVAIMCTGTLLPMLKSDGIGNE
jgi:hypothetical protein